MNKTALIVAGLLIASNGPASSQTSSVTLKYSGSTYSNATAADAPSASFSGAYVTGTMTGTSGFPLSSPHVITGTSTSTLQGGGYNIGTGPNTTGAAVTSGYMTASQQGAYALPTGVALGSTGASANLTIQPQTGQAAFVSSNASGTYAATVGSLTNTNAVIDVSHKALSQTVISPLDVTVSGAPSSLTTTMSPSVAGSAGARGDLTVTVDSK